jgi:hypothetical protein
MRVAIRPLQSDSTPLSERCFDRIKEDPMQFVEHGLLAVQLEERPLFFSVRRVLLPKPFPYVVFYYRRENAVVVLAIAHGRRRPGYWVERS